jgi:bifunctional UDP-N-acetylglucosamine pyrophosphorylase/glucosamine-1-phosphate N-acetyltransferase
MTATPQIAAIVLAAGQGTRMKSSRPKVLHAVAGRPMVAHVLDTLTRLHVARVVVVVGRGMDAVAEAVAPHAIAIQDPPRGTADAVKAAREALDGFTGDALVLYGDSPFITAETLERMIALRRAGAGVVVLGFRPADPTGYGRLIVGTDGMLNAIVEHRDASPAERAIGLCNSGFMAIDGARLFDLLGEIDCANAKGEFYLTDIVAVARRHGLATAVVTADEAELLGVNSRAELARAEALMQERLRRRAMDEGATLVDPASVYLSMDTRLGRDVTVGPHVVFGPGVVIEDDVEIRAYSHIEGARVASGAIIGPFARLRPGAVIGRNAHIGNFVEIKAAVVGDGAKANHLAYLGDATVGAGANIGAGTITCNYDGFVKSRTEIGAGAFIGSNSALVAPVKVGDGAIVGAGSVITADVPADALALERAETTTRPGWAAEFRRRRKAAKAKSKIT